MFGKFSKKIKGKKSKVEPSKVSLEETSAKEEESAVNVVIHVNEKTSYEESNAVDDEITNKVEKVIEDLQQAMSGEEQATEEEQAPEEESKSNAVVDEITTKVEKVIEDIQQAVSGEEQEDQAVSGEEEAPEEESKSFFLQSKLIVMKVGSILDRSVDVTADKIMFWQDEAAKEEEEKKEESQDKEQKEGEDEEFAHKVEVFVDGVAIQTIRLTSAGMEHLKTFLTEFLAQVQEDERYKDASEKALNFWLVEKLTAFFNTAKEQELAKDENQVASEPEEPVVAAEEETSPEIDASTGVKSMISQWWPFGNAGAEEMTPKDDVRNDETVKGAEVTTEEARETVEAALNPQ